MAGTAAALPKQEVLVRGSLYVRLATISTESYTSNKSKTLYGPMFIKAPMTTRPSGLFVVDANGYIQAWFGTDGLVHVRGVVIPEASIAGTSDGFYFKNNAGTYILWIDSSGDLHVTDYIIGAQTVSLEEIGGGMGSFPMLSVSKVCGPYPKVILTNPVGCDTPLLQTLDVGGNAMVKMPQTSALETRHGIAFGVMDVVTGTVHGSL